MPSVIYRDPKIKINAVVYKDTTVRVKKLVVGTPVKRVTAGSFDITNLGGVDPAGKTAGSILAYNASTTKWSTTNFATGNNISIAFDSAANTFTFGTNAALTDVTSLDATTTSTVRGVLSASGDLAYNSSTGQFSIDVENVYTKANFDSDLGLANTGQLPEGSNLYYTTSRADSDFDTRLATKNTGNLSEGSNLYYTDARSRGSISVTDTGGDGSLAYNNSTGVVTYTGPSASETRAHVSAVDAGGDGSFTYNSGTGAFTYTGPSAAEVRAHITANKGLSISSGELNIDSANVKGMFSGGTGVTYNNGVISIGQPVATTSNVTFNDVIISGDLTVSGTQTTVNTETILLADNVIVVNSNATGSPTENGGIEVERGDDANKTLIWNETDDKWTVGSETFVAERFEGDVDGALLVDVYNNTGSTLSKGDAVYLTGSNNGDNPHVALADADDASKMPALGIVKNNIGNNSVGQVTTSGVMNDASHGYTLGSDLYISSTAGQLTTTKPTGEANLIQKIGKVVSSNHIIVQGAFRTNQTPNLNDGKIFIGNGSNQSVTSTLDTSIVPENSNLYHTTARARGAVSAGGDLSYNSSTGVFSIDVEDAYTKVNFDSDLSAANTGQLPEGSNLYYTSARSDSDAKNAISVTDAGGDGSLSYNTSTGVITYTGASAAEVRAHLTANKGLSVTDGEFNIDSANVRGMFSASGDLSYNSGTGQFSVDVENVYTKANFDSDLGLANTGQLPEGSNLYYTDSRADARITAALIDEDDMTSNSATRLPSQQSVKAYVDSQVQSKDALSELSGTTDDVTEGSTNLYHTDARVDARITTA
ncbi:hypothetical protein PQZ07_00005, partial [bacterium]|nr:hypothetical protein [bacterium]